MFLYHYYEKEIGPFKNLSDLTAEEAELVMEKIKKQSPSSYTAKRDINYMKRRIEYETLGRKLFLKKGGKPTRKAPHYMVVEECEFLKSWYIDGCFVKISVEKFDLNTISFTYGDMHPTFSPKVNDGKEYRKKLYTYSEILKIIEKYGLPQLWNADGKFGSERYIEVQIWSDDIISKYL
ncbi:hypothetical protein [Clostridium oryzae]|uniref:Uncharacterized protein n=1 Tax=Clostridium oryzae TaxID=1450648 RepID=A0A1V4IVR5_9CLOT|nr:hypothetical protein [Clostridium oryzae]OPJ64122.1 hypothetical protein CLORY_06690 [Clostridium oryzae]